MYLQGWPDLTTDILETEGFTEPFLRTLAGNCFASGPFLAVLLAVLTYLPMALIDKNYDDDDDKGSASDTASAGKEDDELIEVLMSIKQSDSYVFTPPRRSRSAARSRALARQGSAASTLLESPNATLRESPASDACESDAEAETQLVPAEIPMPLLAALASEIFNPAAEDVSASSSSASATASQATVKNGKFKHIRNRDGVNMFDIDP